MREPQCPKVLVRRLLGVDGLYSSNSVAPTAKASLDYLEMEDETDVCN